MVEKYIEAFVHLAKEQTKDSEFEKMTKRIQLVGKKIIILDKNKLQKISE